MTEYYAIPHGAGGSGSAIYPFRIADAWSVIRPGDTLWLLDGVYTGSNSMIHPPAGVAGTPDARITIKAINDGRVLIDGEGIQSRPVHLTWSGNDYFTIEGINAANGLNYVIDAGGVGNVFRRSIAWNAIESTEGEQTWRSSGYNALVEDCVAFGGRYAMGCNQMGNDAPANPMTTFRRCFMVFTEATVSSPKASVVYWYNSDPCRWENCIAIWYSANAPNSQGMFYCATADPYVHGALQTEVIGCLAILKSTQDAVTWLSGISAQGNRRITFDNCISAMSPDHPVANIMPFDLRVASANQSGAKDLYLKNSTGIGRDPSNIHSDWIQTNVKHGGSIAAVYGSESLWFNDGTKGATICKRYEDGVLTEKGLFPWPMNQRIMDALVATGHAPVDVTAELEAIFGPIPDVCRWDIETNGGGEIVAEELAEMTSPAPGNVLPGAEVIFSWTAGVGVTEYWLDVGTSEAGAEIYSDTQGTSLSGQVSGIPVTGVPIYVALWSKIGDSWEGVNYQYTAATNSNPGPEPEPEPEPEPGAGWVRVFIPAWISEGDVVRVTKVEVPGKRGPHAGKK